MNKSIIGIVREWIQWNCLNGSSVTWGSYEVLRTTHGEITVRDLEKLAMNIQEEVNKSKEKEEILRLKRTVNSLNKRLVNLGEDEGIVWEVHIG